MSTSSQRARAAAAISGDAVDANPEAGAVVNPGADRARRLAAAEATTAQAAQAARRAATAAQEAAATAAALRAEMTGSHARTGEGALIHAAGTRRGARYLLAVLEAEAVTDQR
jgi:hypothetical protein